MAHRTTKQFEIKALYSEQGVKPTVSLSKAIAETIHASATWHKTPHVVLQKFETKEFKSIVDRYL